MQQSGCRGEVAAIYTAKYESWPLLRPDELAALPTEVLRASVAELDELCRQTSGKRWGGGDGLHLGCAEAVRIAIS